MAQTFDQVNFQPDAESNGSVQDLTQAYRELERKYRLRTYQAQELIIEKLLYGNFPDNISLQHKLHMFDLDLSQECFMVVIVRPDDIPVQRNLGLEQQEGTQIGLIVSSIFSELLGAHCTCCPANLEDKYAFLLNFSTDSKDTISAEIAMICRDAVKFISDNFKFSPLVCVSGVCDNLQKLHALFRETNTVIDDANTAFTGNVCVRAESEAQPEAAQARPEPSIEKQYLNALVTQDFSTALELTLERVHSMNTGKSASSLDRVKDFLNQRMRTTNNVISVPLSSLYVDGMNLGEYCMQLGSCTSLSEIESQLKIIFNTLDSYYNTTPSSYTGTTGKVVSLISKRYMEPDLSVEMICDSLGKSRSYLSRMFKENTGMNLLDYLHTTRLTAAKKLLNDTNLGIAEIAAKVGYYSGWTLARVFKRYEGITPTAYRKAFCNSNDA